MGLSSKLLETQFVNKKKCKNAPKSPGMAFNSKKIEELKLGQVWLEDRSEVG